MKSNYFSQFFMNQVNLFILLSVIAAFFLIIIFLLKRFIDEFEKRQKPSEEILEWLKSTNFRIDQQNKNIVSTLQSSTRDMNERLDNAAKFIAGVQKNIGEMSEIGRSMKDLQEFLQSPKLRGNIGEHILKEILSQMLPKQSFHLQYSFRSGATVDAAVTTANGIIPIDSKFPMESFRRITEAKNDEERKSAGQIFEKSVKKHIDDISQKYILTDEGTIDYALMYLPSEAVYYEVVNNPRLYDYAAEKRILPVSPMTFYAYMRAILMSFEGQRIEKQARQILLTIKAVQKDYLRIEDNLNVLNRHLTNAYNQMNNVSSSFTLLGQKLKSVQSLSDVEENKNRQKSQGE
ncbi:DNA recombination protein RmuC [Patescibacteria group bacterium]|nr:DNA recombination protein RmuC [Patescibacteria group bacterium]MCL5797955.1 DNA recombination protein RmuC [Patescibacteria group bacterium]